MPRSPSRDRSDRYTGNRGYFHRGTLLGRWKLWLSAAAAALVLGWVGYELLFPAQSAAAHSHGPVIDPHAPWENSCGTCHQPFSATADRATSPFHAGDRWRAVSCQQCHAGAAHHRSVNTEGDNFHAGCANCHHDHGGRTNSLVRLTDGHCVRCHASLGTHTTAGQTGFAERVTGFAADHPEFRLLARFPEEKPYDRRGLKFSHALHMTPGLVYTRGAKGALTPGRLADLSGPAAAERYRLPGQSNDTPITLDCAACHQTEPVGGRAAPSARTDGAYYQPVVFEAHCQSCHPLRAPPGVSDGRVVSGFEVPHRKQPGELRDVLAGGYARQLLDAKSPSVATPGGPGGRFDAADPAARAAFQQEVDRLAGKGAQTMLQSVPDPKAAAPGGFACGKCHDLTGTGKTAEEKRIAAPAVRGAWFPSARFSHVPHRGVTCASCHPGTGAAFFTDLPAGEREPVRITGVESCRQCHSPRRTEGGVNRGGIRHGCTDCHKYHDGDHSARGSPAGVKTVSPDQFLKTRP